MCEFIKLRRIININRNLYVRIELLRVVVRATPTISPNTTEAPKVWRMDCKMAQRLILLLLYMQCGRLAWMPPSSTPRCPDCSTGGGDLRPNGCHSVTTCGAGVGASRRPPSQCRHRFPWPVAI